MAFVNLPANLQDIFNSITDRISKLESGPNQPMVYAQSAQTTATQALADSAQGIAQAQAANALGVQAMTQATTALTQAQAAYALGTQSLIKDANTITNSNNNMTAINTGGVTVYSGASASTGARVVMNSAGIAGYNSGGTATFALLSSTGAFSTTGAIFTTSTISGGTLNINGNAIIDASGFLTATGATITGTITSSNATITGGSLTVGAGFQVTSVGVLTASGANISGAITATSGTITGALTVTGSLTGGTIQTSTGSSAVIMDGASNALQFKNAGSVLGNIVPYSSSGVMMHYGSTPDGSGASYPQVWVGSATASIAGSNTSSISTSSTAVNINGPAFALGTLTCSATTALSVSGQMNYSGVATGAGTAMVLVSTGSRVAIVTSSKRFKQDIEYVTTSGWLDKVLAMKPITYKTSEDFTVKGEPNETQIGFLAEDIADIGGGLEKALVLDLEGKPFSLSYDRLTVFLTLAIKEINTRLKLLEGK